MIDGITGPTELPDSVAKGTGFAIIWHSFSISHPVNPARAGLNQGTGRTTAKPFDIIIESANTSPIASTFAQKKLLNLHLILTTRVGETPVPLFTIDLLGATITEFKEAPWRSFKDLAALPSFTSEEEVITPDTDIPDRRNSSVLFLAIKPQIVKTTYAAIDDTGTAEGSVAGYFNFLTQKSKE
jgi:hypothetical protein